MKELRRDSVRSSSKGLSPNKSPDWVGAGTGRRRGMLTLLCSVSVNLAELRRVLEMKALLRSVSVNLAELRRVFKVKKFWFMDEIVTDGVGHLRT